MRRIMVSSTAILAISVLIAPDIAHSQGAPEGPGRYTPSGLGAVLQNTLGPGEPTGPLSLAKGELAQKRARRLPGLAHVLAQEVKAGLRMSQLKCLTDGGAPCADGGPMETLRGIVIHTNQQGQLALSPAQRQLHRVDAESEIVSRAAEEGVHDTQAAIEAAQAANTPGAAALAKTSETGNALVIEQTITKDVRRSSSDDFYGQSDRCPVQSRTVCKSGR